MTDLTQLPPPEKKVAAKILSKKGYSTRTIGDWLGADYSTISLWAKQDTPEELQQFSTQFEKELSMIKKKSIANIHKRILELVPKEEKLSELVIAGKFVEGTSAEPTNLKRRFVAEEFFDE